MAHIQSTFNNTIISITDMAGAVISWASAGTVGFKGTKKGTPFAAQLAAESAARKAMEHGHAQGGRAREGSGFGPRDRDPFAAGRGSGSQSDQGLHPDPAQWLPPAEETRIG